MGFARKWAARTIERGRFLGSGNYGLLQTIAAGLDRPAVVEHGRNRDGDGGRGHGHEHDGAPGGLPPLSPPEADVPYQHRTEWEPGRRRGEETDRERK